MSAGKRHDPEGRYHVQRYTFNKLAQTYEKTSVLKARTISLAWQVATQCQKEDGCHPDIWDSTEGTFIA